MSKGGNNNDNNYCYHSAPLFSDYADSLSNDRRVNGNGNNSANANNINITEQLADDFAQSTIECISPWLTFYNISFALNGLIAFRDTKFATPLLRYEYDSIFTLSFKWHRKWHIVTCGK